MQSSHLHFSEEKTTVVVENTITSSQNAANIASSENKDARIIDFTMGYYDAFNKSIQFIPRNPEKSFLYPAYVCYAQPHFQNSNYVNTYAGEIQQQEIVDEGDECDIETGLMNAKLANATLGDDIV